MKVSEIVQTEGWKNFMKYLYGWGASVVLLGALFKIMHWPGASLMLIFGMGTEVVIFFFSAFEPLHHDNDWSLVFPELAGIESGDDEDYVSSGSKLTGGGSGGALATGGAGIEKLDVMLESLDVNAGLFENLGSGLNKLTQTATNMADITEATVATQEYTEAVKVASESVVQLTEAYNSSKDNLSGSVDSLATSYQNTAELISQAGNDAAQKLSESGASLLQSYQELADSIQGGSDSIANGTKEYSDKIQTLNQSLTSVNSVYELQLQETQNHMEKTKDIYSGFDGMMSNLKESANATQQYRDQVVQLSNSIAELNGIYGNMLSSLNLTA
jgi:gliding motility-associated protein GldL